MKKKLLAALLVSALCGGPAADIGVCGFGLHDRERDARHLNRLVRDCKGQVHRL